MSDLSAMPGLSALRGRAFDVLVIGGGIVGAGVMREAARRGLRTLLVEQNDFASGTSSRSSKLVHGGLHYLSKLQVGMARSCVEERQRLIRSGAGLIGEREFIKPSRRGDTFPPWLLGLVFRTYDGLAQGARPHRWMQA